MRLARWLLACCALAFATRAQALDLEWRAPAGCPDGAWVEQALAERLGRASAALASIELHVRGEITNADGRASLTLELETDGGAGERRIGADDCETLARAAALIIALAIDPEAVDEEDLKAIGTTTEDATSDATATGTADAAATTTAIQTGAASENGKEGEPIEARLVVRGGIVGDAGSLGAPALGPGLGLGLLLDRSRIEVGLAYLPPAGSEITGRAEPVAELRLLGVGLNGCYAPVDAKLSLGPCLGVEAGNVWGRGLDITVRQRGNALWLAVLAGARVTWWATDAFGPSLAIEAGLPLLQTLFTVEGLGTVHETSGPFARARLGIEARL